MRQRHVNGPVKSTATATAVNAWQAFGFNASISRFTPLGNAGGFSGAMLWRIEVEQTGSSGAGHRDSHVANATADFSAGYCLRRWPATHPTREKLAWIHQSMRLLRQADCPFVPRVYSATTGNSFLSLDGHLWEVTDWQRGTADFWRMPTHKRLTTIATALAKLHAASDAASEPVAQVPPAVTDRLRQLHDELPQLPDWLPAIDTRHGTGLAQSCRILLERSLQTGQQSKKLLEKFTARPLPLRICLRDIWHDHVLLENDVVTGIIDYGAMRWDHVATDLARLLGSLVGVSGDAAKQAIAAYREIRPLSECEIELVEVLDQSSRLLAGHNWVRWLYIQPRQFADMVAVERRIRSLLSPDCQSQNWPSQIHG